MRYALLLAVVLTCTVLLIYIEPRRQMVQNSSAPARSSDQPWIQVSPECRPFVGYESCAVGMAYAVARILTGSIACKLEVTRMLRVGQVHMLKIKEVSKSQQDVQRALEVLHRYGEVLSNTAKPSAASCTALEISLSELARAWKLDSVR